MMNLSENSSDESQPIINGSENGIEKINRKKRPLKKCPEAPKRFKSPYIWFVSEKMEEVQNDLQISSENKATDVMKILAIIWKNLTPMEKLVYEIKAQEDKQRYLMQLSEYQGPFQIPNIRAKKPHDAPKRNMSAFLIYCQEFRSVLRKEHPSLKNTELSTLLANQWKALSEDEKKPYIEEELQGRELYHIQMKEYKKMKESYKLESNEGMAEIKEEEDKETVELIEIAEEVEAEKTQEIKIGILKLGNKRKRIDKKHNPQSKLEQFNIISDNEKSFDIQNLVNTYSNPSKGAVLLSSICSFVDHHLQINFSKEADLNNSTKKLTFHLNQEVESDSSLSPCGNYFPTDDKEINYNIPHTNPESSSLFIENSRSSSIESPKNFNMDKYLKDYSLVATELESFLSQDYHIIAQKLSLLLSQSGMYS